ncbi:MAG: hypothetical protein WKF90_15835 [Pyrinomonadaceae bacterium]
MPKEYDFFRMMHGKTIEEVGREVPSAEDTVDRAMKQLKSRYPLRLLGKSQHGNEYISEEEREANYHIIGAPGEGKSRFLEYNIRQDIKLGNGLCLLDPSEHGDTCQKVLRYCALKNIRNVVYIDPARIYKHKIACIQPLDYQNQKQSVFGVMEAVNNVFGVSKETDTPRIRKYLPAVLRLLLKNKLTLYESQLFRRYSDPKQMPILGFDNDSLTIKDAFRSQYTFENFFSSTVNRFDMFWQEPLSLMLGANTGIDFVKMVRDKWIILVNLHSSRTFSEMESSLLGILVVSQIIQAVDTLRDNHWKGVYYLYMDEAGRYASPQIEPLLTYKRKTGLRLMLAHHYFGQFDNKKSVLQAIKQGARIKIMFNTPSPDDRLEMVRDLGYGGDIPPMLASYANQDLPKQYVIVKKNKESPVRIKVPNVPDITEISNQQLEDYIKSLEDQPWYFSEQEIKDQINARSISTNTPSSSSGKMDESKATRKASVSRPVQGKLEKGIRPDNKKPPEPPPKRPIKI